MGNTAAKPKAPVVASDPNKSPAQVQQESNTGYASGLRTDIMGTPPPIAAATGPRAKPLPDFFSARDSLERARERFRYERDMARYNRRCDAFPCSTACNREFSKCRAGCDGSVLYNADLFDNEAYAGGQHARALYDNESSILARQLAARNRSLTLARHGSMYAGAQQRVHGKDAIARRPVASVGVEQSVNQGNNANATLKPETDQVRLALVEEQKRQQLEANKLGQNDDDVNNNY